jgi:hypothetical protein
VKSVEWRLDDQEKYTPAGDDSDQRAEKWSSWSARVPIPKPGRNVIHFRCTDNAKNPNSVSEALIIHADDNPPPAVINEPSSPHRVVEQEGGVTVHVRGTIEQAIAEVATVEWSLDDIKYEPADRLKEDWTDWQFPLHLERVGTYRVHVRTAHASGVKSDPGELIVQILRVVDF